jgi:hypothetical protein
MPHLPHCPPAHPPACLQHKHTHTNTLQPPQSCTLEIKDLACQSARPASPPTLSATRPAAKAPALPAPAQQAHTRPQAVAPPPQHARTHARTRTQLVPLLLVVEVVVLVLPLLVVMVVDSRPSGLPRRRPAVRSPAAMHEVRSLAVG